MALFEKFGEMDSAEELKAAAQGLLNEGDTESLKALALENGFDEEDAEDWEDFGVEISRTEAAVCKLKVEEKALALPASILISDWVDYVRKMAMEDESIAIEVRKKDKSLANCIGKIMKNAFENQWTVPAEIKKESGVNASKITFGIPSETMTRKLIREYYGGKA